MSNTIKIPLVSSEITGIWNSYMGESLLLCKFKYFLNTVEDAEIRDILQHSLDLCNERIKILTDLFNQERLPVPEGFKDKDVNITAPRLFTDTFYLQYISYSSRVAMQNYTMTLIQIARADIRDYFSKCIQEYIDLYNKSTELKLSKGIFIRAPHVEVPKEVQYVKSESFLVDWFGKKRALLAGEITHIFSINFASVTRKALLVGFAQVCRDKKISNYILRGVDLATRQTDMLNSILENEDIPIPSPSDSYVTDSTAAPFSEKLMLNKIIIICSAKISSIGTAVTDTRRSDLLTIYTKLTNELMEYSKDGLDIMIHNGWLEQPPQAIKHKNLVGVK
ncbi:DUF3231 family protein [Clostridium sp. WILCCON 0269]|uniref:DUF3231 family protein n=1 Tax=Candidatus Clostridium eludens TaxID=3381663 RepID=A0ABW8SNJ9_9CLOT